MSELGDALGLANTRGDRFLEAALEIRSLLSNTPYAEAAREVIDLAFEDLYGRKPGEKAVDTHESQA